MLPPCLEWESQTGKTYRYNCMGFWSHFPLKASATIKLSPWQCLYKCCIIHTAKLCPGKHFCPLHCCVVILCNSLCQLLIELCKLLNSRAVPLIEECFLSCNDNFANFSVTHGGHLGQEHRCLYGEVQPECLRFTYNVVQCGWLTWHTFSTIKHTSKVIPSAARFAVHFACVSGISIQPVPTSARSLITLTWHMRTPYYWLLGQLLTSGYHQPTAKYTWVLYHSPLP